MVGKHNDLASVMRFVSKHLANTKPIVYAHELQPKRGDRVHDAYAGSASRFPASVPVARTLGSVTAGVLRIYATSDE